MTEPSFRVVLIDDDPEFLAGTEMFLASEGFQVTTCPDGRRGFQMIRRLEPDAVLLDHDMPNVSGLEILEQLRRTSRTREIPVIFLTAHRDPDLVSRGFRGGLDDYISKPFRGEELALRLRAVIQRCRGARANEIGDDPDALPLDTERDARFYILQSTNFAAFLRSEHRHIAEFRGHQRRLVHRLRDVLAPDRNHGVSIRRRRDGLVLLFPDARELPAGRARRAVTAANRLLAALLPSDFLAPSSADAASLLSYAPPRFRLLEIRLSGGVHWRIPRLLENLALELERRDPNFQIVEL